MEHVNNHSCLFWLNLVFVSDYSNECGISLHYYSAQLKYGKLGVRDVVGCLLGMRVRPGD